MIQREFTTLMVASLNKNAMPKEASIRREYAINERILRAKVLPGVKQALLEDRQRYLLQELGVKSHE